MRLRTTIAVGVLLGTSLAVSADASSQKKSCNLVVDGKGDVSNTYQGVPVFPADNGLDVVGGDLATDAKNVTAVMKLASEPGSATLYAKRYIAEFTVTGHAHPTVIAAAVSPTGTSFTWGYYGPGTTGTTGYNYSAVPATGKIDGTEITVTVPLAEIAGHTRLGPVKSGTKISGIKVTAFRRAPALTQAPGQVITADEAIGKTAYYAGYPSCVKVGG